LTGVRPLVLKLYPGRPPAPSASPPWPLSAGYRLSGQLRYPL